MEPSPHPETTQMNLLPLSSGIPEYTGDVFSTANPANSVLETNILSVKGVSHVASFEQC